MKKSLAAIKRRTPSVRKIGDWMSRRMFNAVHRHNLVYNTCWEDPRLDRQALQLGPDDSVMVITSAGCNALDYVLTEPACVHAVDMNPRQNALLELKLASIRNLDYGDFFRMFGEGRLPEAPRIYRDVLRRDLSEWARWYWDRRIRLFDNPRRPFYFRGTAGIFAKAINVYMDRVIRVRPHINEMLATNNLVEQRQIYRDRIERKLFSRPVRFAIRRDATLSMLGVPRAQRDQIEMHYEGGIARFIQDCVEAVFSRLPLFDNYFWRVYLTGRYTRDCCPEYLREENFERLKGGLVDRLCIHTDSVQGFLETIDEPITRFVLLDHMDWLSSNYFPLLELEWQAIIDRAAPGARIIWRSGGLRTDFIERVRVDWLGRRRPVIDLLSYDEELAARLHALDRVHTYGSFYIAEMAA